MPWYLGCLIRPKSSWYILEGDSLASAKGSPAPVPEMGNMIGVPNWTELLSKAIIELTPSWSFTPNSLNAYVIEGIFLNTLKSSYAELEGATLMDNAIAIATDLIIQFEGWSAKAYKCPAGIWTIGWGRTGKDVKEGAVTTKDAERKWMETKVDGLCSYVRMKALNTTIGLQLNDNQVAALASFLYNIGEGAFKGSSVRRNLLLGKNEAACEAWARWEKAGGIVLKGLQRRRAAEIALFNRA
jgi:lysozyme